MRCLIMFLVGAGIGSVSYADESARGHFHKTVHEIQERVAHFTGRDLVLEVARDPFEHLSLRRYAAYSLFEQSVTGLMTPSDSIAFAGYLIKDSDDPVIAYFGELILVFQGVSKLKVYPESIGLHQEWNQTFGVDHGGAQVWQSFSSRINTHGPVWAQSLAHFVPCSRQFKI